MTVSQLFLYHFFMGTCALLAWPRHLHVACGLYTTFHAY